MSQSLLYHGFGLRGLSYRSTSYLGNAIILHVEVKDRHVACPFCEKKDTIFKGQKMRYLKMPPLGGNKP